MKSKIITTLAFVGLLGVFSVRAGETITLKLSDAKQTEGNKDHFGVRDDDGALFFYSNGTGEWSVKVQSAGEYMLTVNASCASSKNGNAKFKVTVEGKIVGKEVELTSDSSKDYTANVKLKEGANRVGIGFTNDEYKEGEYDRNLFIHRVSLEKKQGARD